ncbi:multiple sugar transport system permease protein/N-acetylglucosamine transport system permease protein [Nonomuraea thailandensis]|uniref:Multiple sugar transport system permease protein/N-acetylglucosamine transport system permease protein n=1 Tax=Nonomuraea thailandensis TaxID=1188745 RepID=A0A9X2GM09_9ACTN|nr:carbohydrate ABC transporter permease [Nonomuraea thailandensis]MCP2358006.1 multiple sugar transport system permease protein/N-acetylglucosamine transport system permease protein [Nonomuraea thailandensis]
MAPVSAPAPVSARLRPRHAGFAVVWLLVAFDILVLLWMLLSSLKTAKEIFAGPFSLPATWQFDNWARAWQVSEFGPAIVRTVVVVAATAAGTVAIAAPAAYALSRFRTRSASPLTSFFALGLGIPVQAIMLPLFVVLSQAGLVDSLTGLIIVYIATSIPFAVFFLTAFFRSLPGDLEEAAAIDGATPWRTFWQIMLPLARSGIVTLLILNVIQHWSEGLLSLIFLQDPAQQTLPLALLGFLTRVQYSGADWGGLFAALGIVILPLLVIYLWLGRRIIEGMTLGSGK